MSTGKPFSVATTTHIVTSPRSDIEGVTKLDLGCGKNKKEGFYGLDQHDMPGVDLVIDLATERLPFADNSIEEVHTSHFIEHLTADERCHVLNELYRVMVKDAQLYIIVPHWASCRAYGDPTHKWPPIGEFWPYYLKKEWRDKEAPHTDSKWNPCGYACDFEGTWGFSINPLLATKSQENQQFATQFYKEAIMDLHITMKKV